MKKPKGWRTITVDERKWFWVTSGETLIAVLADKDNRTRCEVNWRKTGLYDMVQSADENTEGEFNEVPVVTPHHVARWLKAWDKWVAL